MAIISEQELKQAEDQGMVARRDKSGNIIAWKGPWLPNYYTEYMECLRANWEANRKQQCAKQGLNEFGQTKEMEASFKRRQALAKEKTERAELLAIAREQAK